MNDQPAADRTLVNGAPELPSSQTHVGSASPQLDATIAGPSPRAGAAPVTLPPETYAVGAEIARGGMGSILRAEDRKLGRTIAMKVMRLSASASESARARFVREATVLARLEHPNIVPIHELGRDTENRL